MTAPGCSEPVRDFSTGGGSTSNSTTSKQGTGGMGTTTSTGGTATGGNSTDGASTGGTGTGGVATGGTGTGGMATGGSGTGGTGWCNPFTSDPCDIPNGYACDFNGGGFSCFGPPNTEALCAPCASNGMYCMPGMTCHVTFQVCVAFCCNDGDCSAGSYCDFPTLGSTGIGVCLIGVPGTPDGADCGASLPPVSGGSCFLP